MLRILPVFLGLALAALWVFGLCADATVWLTWLVSLGSLGCFAAVGLVPERGPAWLAGALLLAVGGGLVAAWFFAQALGATLWLSWWTLTAGVVVLLAGGLVGLQGALEKLRTRETV